MNKLILIFASILCLGFVGCSDDDKDPEREKLETQLASYKNLREKAEEEIIEKTKYCKENEASEGGYEKCYKGWIEPIEKGIVFYDEKIAEIEKQLGISK